jgi:hypothetical protein
MVFKFYSTFVHIKRESIIYRYDADRKYSLHLVLLLLYPYCYENLVDLHHWNNHEFAARDDETLHDTI